MEKEFELSEKWYVIVTKENCKVLSDFKVSMGNDPMNENDPKTWYKHVNEEGFGGDYGRNKRQLITFEQFKQYVLKEPKSVAGFKVGDWIYCTDHGANDTDHKEYKTTCTEGDVFQIDHFAKQSWGEDQKVAVSTKGHCVYIEECNHYFRLATLNEIFKSTTKEELNSQFKLKVFPEEGFCRESILSLKEYLIKRPGALVEKVSMVGNHIGIAWNKSSYWFVSITSDKPEYLFEDLEHFLPVSCSSISVGESACGSAIEQHTLHSLVIGNSEYIHKALSLTLAVGDEELPMVSATKIKSVKTFINND